MRRNMLVMGWMVLSAGMALGQGSLTPPGEPAPTMKTLDELDAAIANVAADVALVEPRVPISSSPIVLDESGSYYLTRNLTGKVTVSADNISLDLMGFSINPASGNALEISSGAIKNIRVHNGSITAPNASGIDFSTSAATANGCIENLRIYDCATYGIAVGSGFIVRNIQVQGAGYAAIGVYGNSHILDCSMTENQRGLKVVGSGALIENNRVWGNVDNYDFATGNQLNLLICEIPESLDWPCSVKLVGTLECTINDLNGITVAADNVTIDMDGHTLVGSGSSSGSGIYQSSSFSNLRIFNGKLINWKGLGQAGVYAGQQSMLSNLHVEDNYIGIRTISRSVISSCILQGNAIDGINADHNCTISDCVASANGDDGISVDDACVITRCTTQYNSSGGIRVYHDCHVFGNTSDENHAGIYVVGDDNRIESNNVTDNTLGLDIIYAGNLIVRNSASGSVSNNYEIISGNKVGTIQTTPVDAGAWDNFSF